MVNTSGTDPNDDGIRVLGCKVVTNLSVKKVIRLERRWSREMNVLLSDLVLVISDLGRRKRGEKRD